QCETFGLVELAVALFGGMQRDGNDPVPVVGGQLGFGCLNEQAGEKRLEPESALIFVTVDHLEEFIAGDNGRASARKVRLEIPAIGAVKSSRDGPLEWKTATFAKRRRDPSHLRTASPTDKALSRSRSFLA